MWKEGSKSSESKSNGDKASDVSYILLSNSLFLWQFSYGNNKPKISGYSFFQSAVFSDAWLCTEHKGSLEFTCVVNYVRIVRS